MDMATEGSVMRGARLFAVVLALLGVVVSAAADEATSNHADVPIPPLEWGEPGLRECMIATRDRWYRGDDDSGLPAADISTHGPRVPAFPGAEGFGAHAFGGRGGQLYRVTNLNDSGPGSLREAAEAEGPRIVIFDVSGTIHLKSRIEVMHPYITIAGQTAPGDGITVSGRKFDVRTYDAIIRHMRFRRGVYGDDVDEWTFRIRSGAHVIADHITVTWGCDGNVGVTHMDYATVQNSVLAKPLHDSIHPKGVRGYGALVRGRHGARYSFLRNLWANHRARVPRPGNYVSHEEDPHGLLMDFRNNVIYQGVGANYDNDSITQYNIVNNYILTNWRLIEHSPHTQGYFAGNVRANKEVEDQWGLLRPGDAVSRDYHEQDTPFETGDVTTLTAAEAWETVMEQAGAWQRDSHDENVIREVRNYHAVEIEGADAPPYSLPEWWREGAIDCQSEVGGLPELASVTMPDRIDSNRNGLPDWWEAAHGLDPDDPGIANKDSNGNGYTNIEEYINDLDAIRRTHTLIEEGRAS